MNKSSKVETKHSIPNGIWTALITPFTDTSARSVDWNSFEKLCAHQARGGVAGVVISGTTGEAPCLSANEKSELIKVARSVLPKEVRVMAGTGTSCTADTILLSGEALKAGADSLLVVTPPYNKPNPAGMAAHFNAIANSFKDVPICLYHVPGRTAQKLSGPQISSILKENPNISSVKEASADLILFSELCRDSGAAILSGDDPTYLASLAIGAAGCISVVSNVFPRAMVEMTKLFLEAKDIERSRAIHDAIAKFIDLLFIETNPCPTKFIMADLGYCNNHFRLPLAPVSPESALKIKKEYIQANNRLRELGAL